MLVKSQNENEENGFAYAEIDSIKVNGHEILFADFEERSGQHYLSATENFYSVSSLRDVFSSKLCIPLDLVVIGTLDTEEKSLALKKYVLINSKENSDYL